MEGYLMGKRCAVIGREEDSPWRGTEKLSGKSWLGRQKARSLAGSWDYSRARGDTAIVTTAMKECRSGGRCGTWVDLGGRKS